MIYAEHGDGDGFLHSSYRCSDVHLCERRIAGSTSVRTICDRSSDERMISVRRAATTCAQSSASVFVCLHSTSFYHPLNDWIFLLQPWKAPV